MLLNPLTPSKVCVQFSDFKSPNGKELERTTTEQHQLPLHVRCVDEFPHSPCASGIEIFQAEFINFIL